MSSQITSEGLEARYFEILKRVCQGESFTITVDGKQVAEINPSHRGVEDAEELCSSRFEGASDGAIREWLDAGSNKA